MWKYFMIILMAMCCVCCKEKNTLPLKISTRQIEVAKAGGEYNVTITGNNWWLQDCVMIDRKDVHSDKLKVTYGGEGNKRVPIKIEGEWFTIQQKDKETLYIKIAGNDTGKDRTMLILLQSYNYFPDVLVTQKGK